MSYIYIFIYLFICLFIYLFIYVFYDIICCHVGSTLRSSVIQHNNRYHHVIYDKMCTRII